MLLIVPRWRIVSMSKSETGTCPDLVPSNSSDFRKSQSFSYILETLLLPFRAACYLIAYTAIFVTLNAMLVLIPKDKI